MANVQTILARQPFDTIDFDAGTAFELGTPDDLPTHCLLEGTGWTLFSFDFKRAEAVFLDIGADSDLSAASFSYDLQYERAMRLMRLTFADFIELAKQIRSPSRLVHLFNIGHCGSTLLHHVFNRAGGVWCISEPLFTFDAAMRRGDASEEDIGDLLRAGLQFLRLYPGANDADVVVVKHFSQATLQIPVYAAADPSAKRLFLYREGKAWCNSVYHFVQRHGTMLDLDMEQGQFIWWILSGAKPQSLLDGVVDMAANRVGFDALAAVAWVLHLRDDVLEGCKDVEVVPLRYDELIAERGALIAQVFGQCGIDASNIPAALLAFDADSHAGSKTSRAVPALDFGKDSVAVMERIFVHPKMLFPADTVLPGSLMP